MANKIELTPALLSDLKENAEKATPGPWKVSNDISQIVTTGNPSEVIGWQWPDKNVFECNVEANSNYIAAANPAVVLALIERQKIWLKIEEEADWLATWCADACEYHRGQCDGCAFNEQSICYCAEPEFATTAEYWRRAAGIAARENGNA